MSIEVASGGGSVAGRSALPGHITVRRRALTRVAEAVSADALGVGRERVSVTLRDDGGRLALVIDAPIRIPDLDAVGADFAGPTVLQRISSAQQEIRERTATITGSAVGRVDVRVTGASIFDLDRVK